MTQDEALDILKMGHSTFLTGEAGTGKTYLLREYIAWLRDNDIEPAVTASTGIAATHISGRTIHSWSGIGIKNELTESDLEEIEQREALWNRLNYTPVVIIDEISMLSAGFIDMFDRILRHIRRTDEPFGGIQVIFSGDFFQLPPVTGGYDTPRYAFEARSWQRLSPIVCYLTEQFRHGDEDFLSLLSRIRSRDVTDEVQSVLRKRTEAVPEETGQMTRLFTHNVDVDDLNRKRLDELDGFAEIFDMKTKGSKRNVATLKRGCLAQEKLHLKPGAEVMFIKNDPAGEYVNGTRGTVQDIQGGTPIVEIRAGGEIRVAPASWRRTSKDGKVQAEITQIPLRLAWAVTVHKSQGMTLDEAIIDLSQCFAPGQGYVALSRVRSLDGLYLNDFNSTALEVEERVSYADATFRRHSEVAQQRLDKLDAKSLAHHQKSFLTSAS